MKLAKISRREIAPSIWCEYYECKDKSIEMLVLFLLNAIETDWSYEMFTQWLKGKEHQDYNRVSGEVYGLVERDGRVYVYDEFAPEEEHYNYFNTTKKNMFNIINDWIRTMYRKPRPNTIIVTEENEEVKFTIQD